MSIPKPSKNRGKVCLKKGERGEKVSLMYGGKGEFGSSPLPPQHRFIERLKENLSRKKNKTKTYFSFSYFYEVSISQSTPEYKICKSLS